MAEVEFGGMTFKGGRMMVMLTALSTLGGAAWAGFEFYADYMDMKEIVQNIDTDAIAARNLQIEQKLDDAIEYTRDIKSGLSPRNRGFTVYKFIRCGNLPDTHFASVCMSHPSVNHIF